MSQTSSFRWWPDFALCRIGYFSCSIDYRSLLSCSRAMYLTALRELTFQLADVFVPQRAYARLKLIYVEGQMSVIQQWPSTLTSLHMITHFIPDGVCFPQSLRFLSLECLDLSCSYSFEPLIYLKALELRIRSLSSDHYHVTDSFKFPPGLKRFVGYLCLSNGHLCLPNETSSCERKIESMQNLPGGLEYLSVCGEIHSFLPSSLQYLSCMDYVRNECLPVSLTHLELHANFSHVKRVEYLTDLTNLIWNPRRCSPMLPGSVWKLGTLIPNIPFFLNTAHITHLELYSSSFISWDNSELCDISSKYPSLKKLVFAFTCSLSTLESLGLFRSMDLMVDCSFPLNLANLEVDCSQLVKVGQFCCGSCDKKIQFCFTLSDISKIQHSGCVDCFKAQCTSCLHLDYCKICF